MLNFKRDFLFNFSFFLLQQIVIKGHGTSVNQTIDPSMNEVTLFINGMETNQKYTIAIAALNKMGKGPFSIPPLELEIDPVNFIGPDILPEDGYSGKDAEQITWIIAVVSALTLVLIAISAFFFCKWKKTVVMTNKHCSQKLIL